MRKRLALGACLATLFALVLGQSASAAITVSLLGAVAQDTAVATTADVTSGTITAGHRLYVVVTNTSSSVTINAPTDPCGDTYTTASSGANGTATFKTFTTVASCTATLSSGAPLHANFSSNQGRKYVQVADVVGSGSRDTGSNSTPIIGTSTTAVNIGPTATLAGAGEVMFVQLQIATFNDDVVTATGWTELGSGVSISLQGIQRLYYQVQSTNAAVTVAWTINNSRSFTAEYDVFTAAAAASPNKNLLTLGVGQ